jgi:hypothetical protein
MQMERVRTATIVFAMLISGAAAAQTPPPEAPPAEAAPPAPAAEPVPPPPPPPPVEAAPAAPMAPPPAAAPAETYVPAAQPALKIETPNKSSIKLGVLLQPQFQASQPRFGAPTSALNGWGNNFYIRRTRILLGGSLFGAFDYFIDTDFPNLFLPAAGMDAMGNATYLKNTPGMNIQDAFITWKAMGDMVKVDAGYMLPPLAHNAVQGATTLYAWDYFFYTFRSGNLFGSSGNPIGRDVGVQLRGLLGGGLVEYRLGAFQGARIAPSATDSGARNMPRLAGRVQVNLMDPETGFFYAGSYLGTKKVLSIGGSFDIADSGDTNAYKYFAGDVLVDLPMGPAGVLTAQVNFAHWDGGDAPQTVALAKSNAIMAEAGFLIAAAHLSPIVRYERLLISGDNNDETYVGGGLAFWPYGHNTNLKAFYTYRKAQAAMDGGSQFNLQWQLYFF